MPLYIAMSNTCYIETCDELSRVILKMSYSEIYIAKLTQIIKNDLQRGRESGQGIGLAAIHGFNDTLQLLNKMLKHKKALLAQMDFIMTYEKTCNICLTKTIANYDLTDWRRCSQCLNYICSGCLDRVLVVTGYAKCPYCRRSPWKEWVMVNMMHKFRENINPLHCDEDPASPITTTTVSPPLSPSFSDIEDDNIVIPVAQRPDGNYQGGLP